MQKEISKRFVSAEQTIIEEEEEKKKDAGVKRGTNKADSTLQKDKDKPGDLKEKDRTFQKNIN